MDPRALDPSRKLIRREEGATRLISVAQGTSVNTLSSTYPSRETKKRRRGEKERQSACVPPGTNSSRRIFACDTMPECGTARSSTPIPFPFLPFNPFPPRGVYLSAAAETGRGILLKWYFDDHGWIPARSRRVLMKIPTTKGTAERG